jgi:uncharacterized protein (DUF849 family)
MRNHPDLTRELAGKMREYDVKPEIEVFDLSMLCQALRLADERSRRRGGARLKAMLS